MNYPPAIYDKAQRLEQLLLRTEAGESFEFVRAVLDLRVEEQDLPKLRAKYEAGERRWEALVDGRHGHSQKAHSAIREWMYERKRADESLTAPELAQKVQERFGVKLSAGHVNYLLRKVELTRPPGRPQQTEKQAPSSETTTSANETGSSIGNAGLFFPRSCEGGDGGDRGG